MRYFSFPIQALGFGQQKRDSTRKIKKY